jgi:hypothetical protein
MMFDASRRSVCLTTSTSGLSALIAISAESTFGTPTRSVVWMTWRWRFETSTTSSSTIPSVPTPAAARYRAVGEPRPPAPRQEDLRVEQLLLPLLADLGQQEVARVALALLGRERERGLHLVAAVLPQRDAARHRLDVLVAQVADQRVGRQGGAVARRAVQDHALRAVGRDALDPGLEEPARDVGRAGQLARADLLGLAHVDDPHALVEELVDLGGIDLRDVLLDLLDEVGARRAHGAIT